MTATLRVLIVEDSEDDARLLLRELRRGGYEPVYRQVDTPAAMEEALGAEAWDVVISDYSMPAFSGLAALALLRGRGLDTPFIVVSGAIGEEIAVEAMKAGAQDYVMKANLSRLVPAIQRELREAEVRREHKQMQERLLRAERLELVGRIAGQVAHDFNNLLTPLSGYPQLIKRRLPEGHPAIRYCDIMVDSVQKMAEINSDLLALGRRGHFEQQVTDLNEIVEQAVEQMGGVPETLRVSTELDRDILTVKGSPAQLLRVIANLLSNAREAMDDRGELIIRTERLRVDHPHGASPISAGEYVRLAVSDTGMGVPPELRERIFDAFFTTKTTGKRRGSGLGLSVVQTIVEDHQGVIELESTVGAGSTFYVYLPVCREQPEQREPGELRGGSESILVVDDDVLQREVAAELLRSLGYRVEAVASGEEAVARVARDHHVDLLVVDMVMPPGIDGVETLRRVREIRSDQRAIIVSGFSESDRVREAQRLGAGGYLRKPITLEKLGLAVRQELDRTQAP